MIKIAHEAPLSFVDSVDAITDYSYFLVHLFEESPAYLNWARHVVASGRESILDNSIFELEEAFDADKFIKWVVDLKPTWYIIPDALEDKQQTIDNFDNWIDKGYSDVDSKPIAVVQGKSIQEIMDCYAYFDKYLFEDHMIAISFDYSFYEELFPDEPTKYHSWMKGRQYLISEMELQGVVNTKRKHHLLGCGLPQEFAEYADIPWIYSLDTSNPVVCGIKGIHYEGKPNNLYGLEDKPSQKLFELINQELTPDQKQTIISNIQKFKENVL